MENSIMSDELKELLLTRPVVIDGGLSNVLEAKGCDLNHPLWTARVISENPRSIIEAHLSYLEAGASIITTASYQASFPGLEKLGFSDAESESLMIKSVELAQEAIQQYQVTTATSRKPLIAASIGPYGAYLADGSEYTGDYGVSERALQAFHQRRLELFTSSNADLVACETIPSLQEAKVLSTLLKEIKKPSWISFSCKDGSHINDGTPLEKVVSLFEDHPSVFAVGVNCTSPNHISDLVARIKKGVPHKCVVVYPNSGEVYDAKRKVWSDFTDPSSLMDCYEEWIELGADLIGGCCRIGPTQIRELSNKFR